MAWSRIHQTGFEMGRASETPFSNSVLPPQQHSIINPITGQLSFNQTGDGGLGYQLSPEPTIIRTGWTFNTEGGIEDVGPLYVYCRESGGIGFMQWAWRSLQYYTDIQYFDQDGDSPDEDFIDTTAIRILHSDAINAHLGLVMKIGVGGFASFYVNGERVLHFDASASGMQQAISIFAVKIGETGPGLSGLFETHFDDWYIDSGTGAEADEAPPVRRFGIMRPSDNGTPVNWTPTAGDNFECVDEQIGNDNDYNYSSTPTDDDRFEMSMFTLPSDSSIDSVVPICRARAGNPYPQLSLRLLADDGVTAYGSEQELRLGYTYLWERMTTKPSGGSWSESDVNSTEFGYELRA